MTDTQMNNRSMANTTIAYLELPDVKLIYNANAKATAAIAAVKTTLADINKAITTQSLDNTGATTTKNEALLNAAKKGEHVCAALIAYADDKNDHLLASQIHFTHRDFTRVAIDTIVDNLELVHDKAAGIPIADLAPFNVVALDITTLQSLIDTLKNAAPLKKALQSSSKTATSDLLPLFKKLKEQLKKLDNILKTFKQAQPSFVSSYNNARKVIDLGKTQQAEELHLMPHEFEAIFGKKFAEGDTFTIRNHSDVPVRAALSDVPTQMPTDIVVEIAPNSELKLAVSADFGGKFRHWLMIHNPNDLDDAHVTIILAHGKSQSSAQSPAQTA